MKEAGLAAERSAATCPVDKSHIKIKNIYLIKSAKTYIWEGGLGAEKTAAP